MYPYSNRTTWFRKVRHSQRTLLLHELLSISSSSPVRLLSYQVSPHTSRGVIPAKNSNSHSCVMQPAPIATKHPMHRKQSETSHLASTLDVPSYSLEFFIPCRLKLPRAKNMRFQFSSPPRSRLPLVHPILCESSKMVDLEPGERNLKPLGRFE